MIIYARDLQQYLDREFRPAKHSDPGAFDVRRGRFWSEIAT
jgi:hypothetical protein